MRETSTKVCFVFAYTSYIARRDGFCQRRTLTTDLQSSLTATQWYKCVKYRRTGRITPCSRSISEAHHQRQLVGACSCATGHLEVLSPSLKGKRSDPTIVTSALSEVKVFSSVEYAGCSLRGWTTGSAKGALCQVVLFIAQEATSVSGKGGDKGSVWPSGERTTVWSLRGVGLCPFPFFFPKP